MGVRLLVAEADAEQCEGGDGGCGPGEQAPEGVCAVSGQFHLVGDLAEGGLDPVAPLGDDLEQDGECGGAVLPPWRGKDGGAAGGLGGGERRPVEALVRQQVARGKPASSRSAAPSRSLTAAGTMDQARTIRLPRSVLTASRKP
jgi:hypothetical protein